MFFYLESSFDEKGHAPSPGHPSWKPPMKAGLRLVWTECGEEEFHSGAGARVRAGEGQGKGC